MTAPFHIVLICFVLFFQGWILGWAYGDRKSITSGWFAGAWRWLARAFPVVIFAWQMMILYPEEMPSIWVAAAFCGVFAAWFWFVFDFVINLFRGHEWYYLANTKFLDRIFPNVGVQLFAKFILLVASLFFYIQWSL